MFWPGRESRPVHEDQATPRYRSLKKCSTLSVTGDTSVERRWRKGPTAVQGLPNEEYRIALSLLGQKLVDTYIQLDFDTK